jgi:hypothetical protein
MALIKRKTRKKVSKQLNKLVKRHGAEMALALVTGIISNFATDSAEAAGRKRKVAPLPVAEPTPPRKRDKHRNRRLLT